MKRASSALSVLLSVLLVGSIAPFGAPSASADEAASVADIEALLAAGPFVEGEAVVVLAADVAEQEPAARARGVDLLASAEPLMDVSAEAYAEATGAAAASSAAPSALARGADAGTAQEGVEVALVRREGASTADVLAELLADERVLSAEPNYVADVGDGEALAAATDSAAPPAAPAASPADNSNAKDLTAYQWGCVNRDDALVTPGASSGFGVNPPHWNEPDATNASGVVAVVDTGIDYEHPDLRNVMCDMTAYGVGEGGKYGFNASDEGNPADPMDASYHGTHCAGVIAAEWNGFGTSGVASGVQVLAVKVADAGSFKLSNVLKGYRYLSAAMDRGVPLKAVNNSWGGTVVSTAFSLAVADLGRKGAISLVASGNEKENVDRVPYTTGVLRANPYAVVVNASSQTGEPWAEEHEGSNYGVETTDVFAPGQAVLSTMPRWMTFYFPEGDPDPASFETFVSADPGVKAFAGAGSETAAIGKVVFNENRFDVEGGALAVPVQDMVEDAVEGLENPTRSFRLSVPVADENKDLARLFGMRSYAQVDPNDSLFVQVKVRMADGSTAWAPSSAANAPTLGSLAPFWGGAFFELDALVEAAGAEEIAYENGALQLKVHMASSSGALDPKTVLYLDTVATGGKKISYAPASGTSMATPMATGAALVLAESVRAAEPAACAAELAALVKSTVRQTDAFADLCSSGGQVDLSLAGNADAAVPVLTAARVTTGPEGRVELVVEGGSFGSAPGAVRIGGADATVVSWAGDAVRATWPEGVAGGVVLVEVERAPGADGAKGAVGKRAFLLEVPVPPAASTAPLFERSFALPGPDEGFPATLGQSSLIGLDGSLYVLPGDMSEDDAQFQTLWRLDPDAEALERLADLPEALFNASMTAYDGALLAYGEVSVGEGYEPRLYRFDSAAGTWSRLDDARLPLHATIANCVGELLLVGAASYDEGTGEWAPLTGIAAYDVRTGSVSAVGALASPSALPVVAVRGGELYAVKRESAYIERVTRIDGRYAGVDASNALPALAPGYPTAFAAAPVEAGIVLAGPVAQAAEGSSAMDEDVFLWDMAGGAQAFQGLGKRVSQARLFYPSAAAYDGWLYVMAASYYEEGGSVLRATPLATLPQAGDVPVDADPTPVPTPRSDAAPLARTEDPFSGLPLVLGAALVGSAAACALSLGRRRERS